MMCELLAIFVINRTGFYSNMFKRRSTLICNERKVINHDVNDRNVCVVISDGPRDSFNDIYFQDEVFFCSAGVIRLQRAN